MKTLDEIINNEHYTRLNAQLVQRSIELAGIIRQAMQDAEIDEISRYAVRTISSNAGYSDTSLYITAVKGTEAGRETLYFNLEKSASSYFCNDLHCWIEAAKGRARLTFLRDARSLLDEIDAIKQRRIADIEDALKAAVNI